MAPQAKVILSGFSDEAADDKSIDQQFSVIAALGMSHCALRFVDAGQGIKNVLDLSDREVETVRRKLREYGLRISSVGSPIGKVKLFDFTDDSRNRYVEPESYLEHEVLRACQIAHALDTKLIRGFSFYPPPGSNPESNLEATVDRLRAIVDLCAQHAMIFGLEVEANLVGHNGWLLAEIHRRVNHPALALVFDGGNLAVQGYSGDEIVAQFIALKPGLGWLHVKDFRNPRKSSPAGGVDRKNGPQIPIDEDRLDHFVPAGMGDAAYDRVLEELKEFLPSLLQRLAQQRVEGVFLELEPHLKTGGQFGGTSGPDGFGVALRSLCRLLEKGEIGYDPLDWRRPGARAVT